MKIAHVHITVQQAWLSEAGAGYHSRQRQSWRNKVKSVVCVVRLVSVHPSIPVGRTNYHSGASSPWELICTVQSAMPVGMMYLGW